MGSNTPFEDKSSSPIHSESRDSEQQTDKVYAEKLRKVAPFEFNEEVVHVFPDMIERSVPGYRAVLDMTKVVANEFVRPGTTVYDLGCSLGATTRAIMSGIDPLPEGTACRIIAVDNAPAMVQECKRRLNSTPDHIQLEIELGDIRQQPIQNASLVTLNYTLQFIPLKERLPLLVRIHEGLIPGGALILSEKIVSSDATHQDILTTLHHGFKRMNGYSDLEISQKRSALENVLVPESIADHENRLNEAGFLTSMVWYQSLTFVSILAIK